jgi:hypothetical protein
MISLTNTLITLPSEGNVLLVKNLTRASVLLDGYDTFGCMEYEHKEPSSIAKATIIKPNRIQTFTT